ncbi:MAG TPA: hypothetical protein VJ843_02865 [Candidatus Saccharimonadales bacterium]|nr:hypothetical protein [Candidatus Saccharimonadales bacterium]
MLQPAHHAMVRPLQHLPVSQSFKESLMRPYTIIRNCGHVLNFVFIAVVLFVAIYFGCSFVSALINSVWSVSIPVVAVVIAALAVYVAIVVKTYKVHPTPSMLPDATGELRGWLYCALSVDAVWGIITYCPGILPS